MNEFIIEFIEMLGTFAFAVSGFQIATKNNLDWFGAYTTGFFTAVGGGTVRDMLIGVTPFWMVNSNYLLCTAVALLFIIVWKNLLQYSKLWLFFDTVGLGLFTIVGVQKTLDCGFPFHIAIVMGCITGIMGGLMRDVVVCKIPIVLRRDIYAMSCIIGGLIYCLGLDIVGQTVSSILCFITVCVIRFVSIKYRLNLPKLIE